MTKGQRRERQTWSPPPLLPFFGEGSGQRAGVGEVWGVEWDQLVTSGRKNVPVCSVGPLPLWRSTQSSALGPFVFTFQTPNSRAEATDEHTATPRSSCCRRSVHYNLTCKFSLSKSVCFEDSVSQVSLHMELFLNHAPPPLSAPPKC